jgi:GTP diphosphokinase / guanosine-3',5'-bis(diphosphate) 3'-diphosphatase
LTSMPTIKQLMEVLKKQHPKADLDMVQLAFDFANQAHQGQIRKSGEPYIKHALAAAIYLAKMRVDVTTVVASILHDVPEDTTYTVEDVEKNFGPEVRRLVDGVTKLGTLKYRGMERYVENLRKMFMALSADIRVVMIKFADRIHNLQTLDALPPDKQHRIALESMEIYAPIAHRLGMWEVKGELEDLSFKYINPNEWAWVSQVMATAAPTKAKSLQRTIKELKEELASHKEIHVVSIQGREKQLYSLYKKLLRHDRNMQQIYDIIAARVIVKDIAECYSVLGIIHQLWKPLRGRFKDYIAQPKPNGYQSLHTTVFVGRDEVVEFQIRTEKMDEEANYGVAAQWIYEEKGKPKEGTKLTTADKRLAWVNDLVKLQQEIKDTAKYLESLKIEIFDDTIFTFTPKGDVIALPEDATPIDFAYHVHSDLGDQCAGARINGKLSPLSARLKSGDVVQIIADKKRRPSSDWLAMVKTRNAREHIKGALNRRRRLFGLFKRDD